MKDLGIAQQVSVSMDGRRGPDLFSLWVVVARDHTAEEVRERIDERLAEIREAGIPEAGLSRARNRIRSDFLRSIQSNLGLALRLGTYEIYFDDATLLRTELDRSAAVTADDVRNAARTYLVPENRTVLDVVPAAEP